MKYLFGSQNGSQYTSSMYTPTPQIILHSLKVVIKLKTYVKQLIIFIRQLYLYANSDAKHPCKICHEYCFISMSNKVAMIDQSQFICIKLPLFKLIEYDTCHIKHVFFLMWQRDQHNETLCIGNQNNSIMDWQFQILSKCNFKKAPVARHQVGTSYREVGQFLSRTCPTWC